MDSQNLLVSCTTGTGTNAATTAYTYGADGLRRSATVNPGTSREKTTDYVYDGQSLVAEMRQNAQGQVVPTATYLMGPRGVECRIDETHGDESFRWGGYYEYANGLYDYVNPNGGGSAQLRGRTSWYVFDGLGSVAGEVDDSGNLTTAAKYDVYGATRGRSGTAKSSQGFVGALGHTTDATGLVYMRARYYDPNLGRFESEDPAMNGVNWYLYCGNNPVNGTDSTGLMVDILCSSLDDAVERIQEAAQGSAIMGEVLQQYYRRRNYFSI